MILPAPNALEGSVLHLPSYRASDFKPGFAVLCRNTAPLVSFAYGLLQRDVPCRILGRDLGTQLITIVKKLRATSLDNFQDKLTAWLHREVARAEVDHRDPSRFYDQADCLQAFVRMLDSDSQSIASLIAKIELMFSDEVSGNRVLLSTVHKAKGLEFPTVFLLDAPKLMPSRFATQPWQRQQERNLQYVAVTRAMETLAYINSDCWKEED